VTRDVSIGNRKLSTFDEAVRFVLPWIEVLLRVPASMLGYQRSAAPTSALLCGRNLIHLSAQVRANGGNIALASRYCVTHIMLRSWTPGSPGSHVDGILRAAFACAWMRISRNADGEDQFLAAASSRRSEWEVEQG
jgi:hypothetical protein